MPIEDLLTQTVVIQRVTEGAENAHGMAALTWSDLETVKASVQPKRGIEAPEPDQGGATVVTHVIYLLPTDVTPADRIRLEPDDGDRYQLTAVREPAGRRHHFECDAYVVTEGTV